MEQGFRREKVRIKPPLRDPTLILLKANIALAKPDTPPANTTKYRVQQGEMGDKPHLRNPSSYQMISITKQVHQASIHS